MRRLFSSKQHGGGVSKARNLGLDAATGTYVAFVDADDALAPGSLGPICRALDARGYASAHIAYTRVREMLSGIADFEDIEYRSSPNVYSIICRRELIESVRFREGLAFAEDTLYVFECSRFLRGSQLLVKGPVYYYRQHDGSAMHSCDARVYGENMTELARRYGEIAEEADAPAPYRKESLQRRNQAVNAYVWIMLTAGMLPDWDRIKGEGLYPYGLEGSLLSFAPGTSARVRLIGVARYLVQIKPCFYLAYALVTLRNRLR